jgi:hypothetical protein
MTTTYSADDLVDLAGSIDELCAALPIEQAMSKDQALQLNALMQNLGGIASNLRLLAVQDLLAETTIPLSDIAEATAEATATLKRIQSVTAVISLAGDVVLLGTAITLKKWSTLGPTLKSLQADLATFR